VSAYARLESHLAKVSDRGTELVERHTFRLKRQDAVVEHLAGTMHERRAYAKDAFSAGSGLEDGDVMLGGRAFDGLKDFSQGSVLALQMAVNLVGVDIGDCVKEVNEV